MKFFGLVGDDLTMTQAPSSRIRSIKLWSSRFCGILTFVLFALPLAVLASLVASYVWGFEIYAGTHRPVAFGNLHIAFAFGLSFLVLAYVTAFLIPLYFLRKVFAEWASGKFMTVTAAKAVQATGIGIAVVAVMSEVLSVAMEYLLSVALAGYDPEFTLALNISAYVAAAAIFVSGLVLEEAAELAAEAELTI